MTYIKKQINKLVQLKPFDCDYRVKDNCLECRQSKSRLYINIGYLQDIQSIEIDDDVCVSFVFKENFEKSELNTLYIDAEDIYA